MVFNLTFDDLTRIFTRLCAKGIIKQSGYEMASAFVDCLCSIQKQEHIHDAQNRWTPSEEKG